MQVCDGDANGESKRRVQGIENDPRLLHGMPGGVHLVDSAKFCFAAAETSHPEHQAVDSS